MRLDVNESGKQQMGNQWISRRQAVLVSCEKMSLLRVCIGLCEVYIALLMGYAGWKGGCLGSRQGE